MPVLGNRPCHSSSDSNHRPRRRQAATGRLPQLQPVAHAARRIRPLRPEAYGIFSWPRNRKNEAEKAAREQKVDEAAAEKTEKDRQPLLAESRRIAQQTALDSANTANAQVERRCNQCIKELRGLGDIRGSLIDVLEEQLP